jgi:Flp pilus assembly protein TadG
MMIFADTVSTITAPLRALTRRFGRDEAASMSVEAALIAPLLFWAFLATFTYFDVYRVKNVAMKSNYAISDLLSRETNVIDMDYLTGTKNLYRYLTQADSSSWLRVSVVHCTDGCAVAGGPNEGERTLEADWSRATDGKPTFSDADIMDHFDNIIPLIATGERVIIVETTMDYDPPFSATLTGITDQTFRDIVMTRPRFAPQLCFDGVGCGITE